MIANAQQARQLVKNSKHYRLDYLLCQIEQVAKSGMNRYEESGRISQEEAAALRLRGFTLIAARDATIISWEETT